MTNQKQKIAILNEECGRAKQDLRNEIEQFIAIVGSAIQNQSLKIAEEIGKAQPEASVKLGRIGIESLKLEIQKYNSEMPSICAECLRLPSAWSIFKEEFPEGLRYHKRHSVHIPNLPIQLSGQHIIHHIHDALSPLGKLLKRSGFITLGRGSHPHQKVIDLFVVPEDVLTALNACQSAEGRIRELESEIRNLEKEDIEHEARSLWGGLEDA
jgi:hypothetical protein